MLVYVIEATVVPGWLLVVDVFPEVLVGDRRCGVWSDFMNCALVNQEVSFGIDRMLE